MFIVFGIYNFVGGLASLIKTTSAFSHVMIIKIPPPCNAAYQSILVFKLKKTDLRLVDK